MKKLLLSAVICLFSATSITAQDCKLCGVWRGAYKDEYPTGLQYRVNVEFTIESPKKFHYSIKSSDSIEITGGWDALKFTKLRNYSDVFYVTGSLNAGLTYFFNDNFFVNGYYEFNHTHNTLIEIINKIGEGIYPRINTVQPSEQKGHSFGVRVGWMF